MQNNIIKVFTQWKITPNESSFIFLRAEWCMDNRQFGEKILRREI